MSSSFSKLLYTMLESSFEIFSEFIKEQYDNADFDKKEFAAFLDRKFVLEGKFSFQPSGPSGPFVIPPPVSVPIQQAIMPPISPFQQKSGIIVPFQQSIGSIVPGVTPSASKKSDPINTGSYQCGDIDKKGNRCLSRTISDTGKPNYCKKHLSRLTDLAMVMEGRSMKADGSGRFTAEDLMAVITEKGMSNMLEIINNLNKKYPGKFDFSKLAIEQPKIPQFQVIPGLKGVVPPPIQFTPMIIPPPPTIQFTPMIIPPPVSFEPIISVPEVQTEAVKLDGGKIVVDQLIIEKIDPQKPDDDATNFKVVGYLTTPDDISTALELSSLNEQQMAEVKDKAEGYNFQL
jgi:hypothetical protein